MLERLSAPQRWIVGGAVLAFIILLAAYALSRDIARRADAPAPPTAAVATALAATPLPRPTPAARPPVDDAGTTAPTAWLALALAGVAVAIAVASALVSHRRLAELHRRQANPVLYCRLGWDASDDHLVVSVWNAGPGSVTTARCGLTLPAGPGRGAGPLTAYATHPGLAAGQELAIPFPAVSRAALAVDAGLAVAIALAWRPATAGSEEIVHHFRHDLDATRAGVASAGTGSRLAPQAITFARDAATLPGEPRPTR
jgi:hypothetical protein